MGRLDHGVPFKHMVGLGRRVRALRPTHSQTHIFFRKSGAKFSTDSRLVSPEITREHPRTPEKMAPLTSAAVDAGSQAIKRNVTVLRTVDAGRLQGYLT